RPRKWTSARPRMRRSQHDVPLWLVRNWLVDDVVEQGLPRPLGWLVDIRHVLEDDVTDGHVPAHVHEARLETSNLAALDRHVGVVGGRRTDPGLTVLPPRGHVMDVQPLGVEA